LRLLGDLEFDDFEVIGEELEMADHVEGLS
jgi:hypothetical protein